MKLPILLIAIGVAAAQVHAADPTAAEQYLLELVNRARASPSAEAARYGINLNEGLPGGKITTAAKPPLSFSTQLTQAAHAHSQWMVDTDNFDHTGSGGSTGRQRTEAAGYSYDSPAILGENIGLKADTGNPDLETFTADIYADLFVDSSQPGRLHRLNIMDPNFDEGGMGVVAGPFTIGGTAYNSVVVTQDFAASSKTPGPVLTGVVIFDDDGDQFYSIGEGAGGVAVLATKTGGAEALSTTTTSAGGYNLALTAGTWNVNFSGGGITTANKQATIGGVNVKLDLLASRGTATPFSTWMAGFPSLTGANAGEDADPDHDGLTNFEEFTLAGNPTRFSSSELPTQGVIVTGNGLRLTYTFVRSRPAAEVTYRIETAASLAGPWTVIATNPGSEGARVTVDVAVTPGTKLFLRLKAVAQS